MADWAAVIVALLSMLFSAIFGCINYRWNQKLSARQEKLEKESLHISNEQLKISKGLIELEMSAQLSAAKKYVDGYESMCLDFLSEQDKRTLLKKKKEFVMEEYLNCMENLCQKYIDGTIDRKHFKKNYSNEIKNLFSRTSLYKEKLDGDSSPFRAIKRVYNQWEDH